MLKFGKNKKKNGLDRVLFLKSKSLRFLFVSLMLASFSLLSARNIFRPGFFRTIDDITTVRIVALLAELKSPVLANFPVRLSSSLAHGYSYPVFLFYAPLTYYAGALLMLFFNLSHIVATKAVYVFPLLAGPIFFYFAARHNNRVAPSLIGALLFAFFPFRGWETYYRGGVGEAWAMAFLPLVFGGIFWGHKNKIGYWLSSLALALIIVSHNISGLLVVGLMIGYGLVSKSNKKYWLTILVGLGLSLFYWLPSLFYLKSVRVNYSVQNTGSVIDFLRPWLFVLTDFSYQAEKIYSAQLVWLGIFSLLYFLFSPRLKKRNQGLIWSGLSIGLIFLLTNLSQSVWQLFLPVSRFIQFPWRLFILLSFSLSYLLVILLNSLPKKKKSFLTVIGGVLVVYLVSLYQPSFGPKEYSFYYEYKPEDSGPCATSWGEEYLPVWVKECAEEKMDGRYYLADGKEAGRLEVLSTDQSPWFFEGIYEGEENILYLNKYYFPGWQARVNSKPADLIYQQHQQGLVGINLPSGRSEVKIWYQKTTLVLFSELVSFGFGLVLVIGIWQNTPRGGKKK